MFPKADHSVIEVEFGFAYQDLSSTSGSLWKCLQTRRRHSSSKTLTRSVNSISVAHRIVRTTACSLR